MQTASDYVYQGLDNRKMHHEPGDYIFEVVEVETGISAGQKTRGCRTTTLKMILEPDNVRCRDVLYFHPSMGWKVDTFVKSAGLDVKVGQAPEELKPGNERLLVGLRGWCTVSVEEWRPDGAPADAPPRKSNRVEVWLTNKGKLERKPPPAPTDDDDDKKVPF